jgi:hypothetical protein
MSDRRDDIFSKWYAITNYIIQPLLPVDVFMAVLWVPALSKDNNILHDRFVIGTYGNDQYQDVVKDIVFKVNPVDPSFIIINGTMVRYTDVSTFNVALPRFPKNSFTVEVHLVRGSKLQLDYIRDLVYNMGIPENELLDVVYEKTGINIVCSSLSSAAVLLRRGPAYAPEGIDGWRLILKDQLVLPEVMDSLYPVRRHHSPTGDYPGPVYAPVITRSNIAPLAMVKKVMLAPVPSEVPGPKHGPQFKLVNILPRPQPSVDGMQEINSQVQNVSITTNSSMPTAPLIQQEAPLSDEFKAWINILLTEDLPDDSHYYLANVVNRQLQCSALFRDLVANMTFPALSVSGIQGDDDDMEL